MVTDTTKHAVLAGGMRNAKVRDRINSNIGKLVSCAALWNEVVA